MALTRCWRQRAKAIPAQVTWALLGIILEFPCVSSGPWDVPWGGFGVSPGVVAHAEGSSAGIKQPRSHIAEPVLAFSLWKFRERGVSTQKKWWEWGQEWWPGFGEHVGTALPSPGLSCWKDLWGCLGSSPAVSAQGQRENSWEQWDPKGARGIE